MQKGVIKMPRLGTVSANSLKNPNTKRSHNMGALQLITGGTGSFGKRFVETICREYKPRKLIIFSRDELKQYEMAQQFSPQQYPFLRYFIGDVRDESRLEQAMRRAAYPL